MHIRAWIFLANTVDRSGAVQMTSCGAVVKGDNRKCGVRQHPGAGLAYLKSAEESCSAASAHSYSSVGARQTKTSAGSGTTEATTEWLRRSVIKE
jgi:hypothetical protein